MIGDLLLEFKVLLCSIGFEFVDLLLVSLDAILLGLHDTGEDSPQWVQLTLELGFKGDFGGFSLSQILIEMSDINVTAILEVSVLLIVLLLLRVIPIFKVTEGSQ